MSFVVACGHQELRKAQILWKGHELTFTGNLAEPFQFLEHAVAAVQFQLAHSIISFHRNGKKLRWVIFLLLFFHRDLFFLFVRFSFYYSHPLHFLILFVSINNIVYTSFLSKSCNYILRFFSYLFSS